MAKKGKNPWGLYDPRAPFNVSPIDRLDLTNPAIWTSKTGSVKDSRAVEVRHISRRPTYTKSPPYAIPGTSSFGRMPTSYSRLVYSQVTSTNCVIVRNSNLDRFNSPLDSGKLNALYGIRSFKRRLFYDATEGFPWGDVDIANDRARATTECLNKLGDNKVDFGVALAELRKTVHHLATTAQDLWETVKALRGRKYGRLLDVLSKRSALHSRKIVAGKTAAQYWLEYNYAWKPLINEAYGLYELLREQLEPALLVHANRTVYNEFRVGEFGVRDPNANWRGFEFDLSGEIKMESTCRLTGRVNSDLLRSVSRGMTNPAVVLWELVPYSFVVDWSIPINATLEAATATRGLTFVWGSVTQRFQSALRCSFGGLPSITTTIQRGEAEIFKYGMRREALNNFPRPLLYAKSPFSTSHLVSATALFRQLL